MMMALPQHTKLETPHILQVTPIQETQNLADTTALPCEIEDSLKLIIDILALSNTTLEENRSEVQKFQTLKTSYHDCKAKIETLIDKIQHLSHHTLIEQIIKAIKQQIVCIENIILSGVRITDYCNQYNEQIVDYNLQIKKQLYLLKTKLPVTEQQVLDVHLQQYQTEFQQQITSMEQQHQEENDLLSKRNFELQQQLTQVLRESEQQQQKLRNINSDLNYEISQLNQHTIRLNSALASLGITIFSSIIGSLIIPIPGFGTAAGATAGVFISYNLYKYTNGQCIVQ